MSTTTIRVETPAPDIAVIDRLKVEAAEADVRAASAILRSAAVELADAYRIPADEVLAYDDAVHRFALANKLADQLTTIQSLVGSTLERSAEVILAQHKDRENIDIEGETWHRYDEWRSNAVSWKTLAEKAKSYLTGAQLGVLTAMENKMKKGGVTYLRLKPGPAKPKRK